MRPGTSSRAAAGYQATVTDLFCGAGGSSTGLAALPGVHIVMAANHWDLAVDSHNANHPDTDHDVADISGVDPRRYPRTDVLWASPECTTWSQARGRRRDFTAADQYALFDAPLPDEATVRSRATMGDVVRFTAHHRYEAVIVENVVDIRAWALFDDWVGEMHKLGYAHHEVYLNSMHAWGAGVAAPQSRDRIYVVFWKRSNRAPDFDKWLSPPAWCDRCAGWVRARQWWKNPGRRSGRYGRRAQYLYRCPAVGCHRVVDPAALPAAVAIDWSLAGERIGARARPLAAKTRARIAAGIRRYARPFTLEAAGHTFERRPGVRTWPADQPLTTLTGTATRGVACPPMLVPVEGRGGKQATPAAAPLRTQTGRGETGLVTVAPFITALRGDHTQDAPAAAPLATVCASGNHLALVMRNNTARGDQGQMTTPVTEPLRTLMATVRQSLVGCPAEVLYSYDTGLLRPVTEPLPTQTTVEGDAVMGLGGLVDLDDAAVLDAVVDECTFRMLTPPEMAAGMAFPGGYVVLGNKGERTRQIGNAVTPPTSRDIGAAVIEAITGEDRLDVAA